VALEFKLDLNHILSLSTIKLHVKKFSQAWCPQASSRCSCQKMPVKQGIIPEIPGRRRSFYEVRYMPGCFLAFLFLRLSSIPSRLIVDTACEACT
jgi:hypothetical protein